MSNRFSQKLRLSHVFARSLVLLALAFGLCQAQWQNRQLLTGFSSAHDLMIEHEPSLVAPTQSLLSLPQAKTQRLSNYESFGDADHHRRLMQFSRVPAPAPSPVSFNQHGQQGRPSSTTVYTIINNNDAVFGSYVCIDACAHGNTCIWQNAWLWNCNGTNPTHHYWVWEPDSSVIRSATTDSFEQFPEICLDMCTDSRYGNGACAVTATLGVLNVGFQQCTGFPNQQWSLQGTQIVNKQNNYCLSAGAQSCGRWSNCNKSQAQTRQSNMILNVFAEPCNASNINQQWSLGPAPNSTLIDFTPLNTSAAKYAAPNLTLASTASNNSQSVVNFVDEEYNMCLSIENQASCQSTQNGSLINNPLSTVCVWQNVFLQTCWSGGSDASKDQGWIYDNSTKQLVLATDVNQNVCLEICTDESFARGSCSLVENNVGIQSCNGSPEQQWEFEDGTLYNELMDQCLTDQPLCLVDYTLFNTDITASSKTVDGFLLGSCLTNIKNGPWAGLPWNNTNGAPIGIKNLVGGPCDGSNSTVRFTTQTAGKVSGSDPVAPGSLTVSNSESSGSKTNVGAIVGGALGGAVGLLLIGITAASFMIRRSRRKEAALKAQQQEEFFKKGMYDKSGHLNSIDSDMYVKPKGGWLAKLDLTDDISPADIEICKKADGEDWKLGEGAFGTVYKANRFGCQPVAVKVLREESSKQIENFQREIELLRGLRDNNIVLFLGVCQKDNSLMLVTEYMPQGDLWHAISQPNNREKFSWYQRGRKIALDVARGLVHLHNREIVHMDLKSPNILLGKDLTAKIADVGLARSVTNSSLTQMTSIGTMAWAAPELKRNFKIGRKDGPRTVSAKADVFSFGVVLWEIVTGEDPCFSSREVMVPNECPTEIEELIEDCLGEEPEERPDMKAVFERLKKAASIPPPGASHPLPTPYPTPTMSREGSFRSPPKSDLGAPGSAPKSAGYTNRLGLAAALRRKLGSGHFSSPLSRGMRSSGGRLSNLRAESIAEDQTEGTPVEK